VLYNSKFKYQVQPDHLIPRFIDTYGKSKEEIHLFFAPGRVNLIGEHTDYNNGFVLPCALSFGTYLAIRKTAEPFLEFHSEGFDYSAMIPLRPNYFKSGQEWVNYPLSVIEMFLQKGKQPGGLQFYYSGNIPPAAGLSSSASIEMVTAFALNDIYNWNYNIMEIILLCRKAENEFVGVSCGIMDQFAVGQGMKDQAVFLDCGSMDFQLVPINFPGFRLVITNTGKKRGLGDSKYNERVEECRKAVEFLSKQLDINSLGELGNIKFFEHQHLIADNTVLKRARHIVTENNRVLDAVKALRINDFYTFGQLMIRSHESLRDDYEVTGFELDSLVEISLQQKGVLGARMTGAGFGGCTVAFVKEEDVDEYISGVSSAYKMKTGLNAISYLPDIGDGVRRIL
jgi:galactokinase